MTNLSEHEVEIFSYNVLLQRHINDDHLTFTRASLYLASSSILFLGFVSIPQYVWLGIRIIIPLIGIFLSYLAIISNRRTSLTLDLWREKEEKLEEELAKEGQLFNFMKTRNMLPGQIYEIVERKKCTHPRNKNIFTYYIPSAFLILWIFSIAWIFIN